ncbi:PEPxxWA-CTERM sorting domain-containing protein [Polymorphobacter megasporae]|nr:PEPxxWA-CTERM sorting domain-containing protein [Polymorphobacter megasporae]UAJ12258.1 PEPxxWA-CTERM sorting domain-containing protein [Polymorphobacter megasporae]
MTISRNVALGRFEGWRGVSMLKSISLGLCCLAATVAAPALAANTFTINYYTIAGTYGGGSGDPDFNTIGCCTPTYYDEVKPTLGALGLPVYNAASAAPFIHDTTPDGQITWWSPGLNSHVTYTGTATVTSPFANYNFYPNNGTGTDDSHGFQGATISGQFNLTAPESVTFSFGADDDAFLALDRNVIAQEGGIHGVSAAPVTTSVLAAGVHNFTLFYVDRNVTGAGLYFNVDTSNIVVTPPVGGVPEPATWAMMVAGFGFVGLSVRRRRPTTVAA